MKPILERQRSEFQARQDAGLKRDIGAFTSEHTLSRAQSSRNWAIASMLFWLRSRPSIREVAYSDLKAGIQREAIDSLMKSDWFTEHKQNFDQLMAD